MLDIFGESSVKGYQNVATYTPELSRLNLFGAINMFLLISAFVMPQYFGIHIGYDITCTRFANILIVVYWFLNYKVFNMFSQMIVRRRYIFISLLFYLLVAFYTMVLRVDINALLLPFLEILTFFMMMFGIRYYIGVNRAIKIINGCAFFLSIYGLVEFAFGHSLYLQFLKTVPSNAANCYRSGFYRIMGPCGHPLGYGLLLILFIAIACIDIEHDEMNFIQNPVLICLLYLNVFLTGSRSSLGIAVLEGALIILFSSKKNRNKTIFFLMLFLLFFLAFLLVCNKTKIGQYIMMQMAMLFDQVFGTEYAASFGASVETLDNSEEYRKYLPKIFTLDWINPLLGRGVKHPFSAEIPLEDGSYIFIKSIDNYYVSQYLKYAYPGLVTYVLFLISAGVSLIRGVIKYKSGMMKVIIIGVTCYFFNLWYLDALQTLKFVYALLALFFAKVLYLEDVNRIKA